MKHGSRKRSGLITLTWCVVWLLNTLAREIDRESDGALLSKLIPLLRERG